METLKTSEEWNKLCRYEILDPDGWDRKNYKYSWYKEPITQEEFENRLVKSTCIFPTNNIHQIWE